MRLKQYQVDAFTDRVFGGNPAAVVPLSAWLDDALLQAIAEENNLSETAFFVASAKGFQLRWFTPVKEVDLCGHATLASAHVIFQHLGFQEPVVTFETRSGDLQVERREAQLVMDFPARPAAACEWPAALEQGLGVRPAEVLAADDYLAVVDSEAAVRRIVPDQTSLSQLDLRGVIVTAPGDEVDFVSRFFAPRVGVPEDPVTGSAHCTLAPYWAQRLGRKVLTARQVSPRGGDIACEWAGDRVYLSGRAVTVMEASMVLPA
ncbi:MAG: PhzF family phenazine biosynthesis protein [Gammaproteobacteria bacterium]